MAIARNGSADLGNNGGAAGSWTVSYSVNAASNFVCFFVTGSGNGATSSVQTIGTATYGGVSLVSLGAVSSGLASGGQRCCRLFGLLNPPTGANNLVVTQTGGGADTFILAVGADYSGAGGVGSVITYTSGAAAETTQSAPSGYLSNANSWVVSGCGPATTNSLTNNALTQVVAGAAFTLGFIFDTNAVAGATGAFANTYSFSSVAFSAIVMELLSVADTPTAYYVNTSTGNDTNAGTIGSPWLSLTRVNAHTYNPGDTVNFQGGQTFGGGSAGINMTAANWGVYPGPTSASPAKFQSYGGGTALISSGSAGGFSAVNLPGVAIDSLNFTGSGIAANAADGIHIENSQAGNTQLSGPAISNCVVTGYGQNGVVVFGSNGNSGFSTVSITGVTSHDNTGGLLNVAYAGIIVYGAGYISGTPCNGTVTISNCAAYNNTGTAGGTHWTGSGIVIGEANVATITTSLAYNNGANCTASGGGPVGIFVYDSNSYTVSFCESHHNHTNNGHDGDGFNCDTNNGGAGLIEYCYSHDNDGFGYLYDAPYVGTNSVTMRYCISQNNSVTGIGCEICMTANSATFGVTLKCFNNTIYSPRLIIVIDATSNWTAITGTIANNIFYAASSNKFISYGASPPTGAPTNLIFDGNNYFAAGTFSLDWNATNYASLAAWKAAFPAQEVHSGSFSTANPLLNSAGGGGTIGGYAPPQPTAYDLTVGSPMVGVGLNLNSLFSIAPGTSDFYGNAIPHGVGTGYNVGAFGAAPGSDPTSAFDIVF